jgi:hypothetical protein
MPTLSELAVQLDEAVAASPPDAAAAAGLLAQLNETLKAPNGCEEFSDISFEVVPSIMEAAALSEGCERAARAVVAAAAAACPARDLFTLLASVLSQAAR